MCLVIKVSVFKSPEFRFSSVYECVNDLKGRLLMTDSLFLQLTLQINKFNKVTSSLADLIEYTLCDCCI